jgi:predicted nucleic acid-binding protein
MLVVDAFCLAEILLDGPGSEPIRQRLLTDPDLFAPHVIDVEVFGVIRGQHLLGTLDATAARMALNDLETRPCERVGHRLLPRRAWELRATVRGWDAMYVALAEVLDAALITTDRRLAAATGPRCRIDLP